MKYELVPKGALQPCEFPSNFDDETVLKNLPTIFSADQQARFSSAQLMTGGWFLECRGNFVHRDEKHLVQVPAANATGTASMEIDDDNDDFSILPGAPAAPAATCYRRRTRCRA